ncbi:MAG TPA: hypothetical protein PLS49_03835 [Candidatus Woesebacteria bacterium]|nr:hypothetical protein [Candidatus Woesebacteria bacterium]
MLTNQDFEKLKQTFATKKDLERFVTKDEWHEQNEVIANEFKGLVELMGEMEERLINRMDEKFAMQDKRFERMEKQFKENDERFEKFQKETRQRFVENDEKFEKHVNESNKKFYDLLEKMNNQYAILFNQEKRLAKTEQKLFSTP